MVAGCISESSGQMSRTELYCWLGMLTVLLTIFAVLWFRATAPKFSVGARVRALSFKGLGTVHKVTPYGGLAGYSCLVWLDEGRTYVCHEDELTRVDVETMPVSDVLP
jgi:hypothetical protein